MWRNNSHLPFPTGCTWMFSRTGDRMFLSAPIYLSLCILTGFYLTKFFKPEGGHVYYFKENLILLHLSVTKGHNVSWKIFLHQVLLHTSSSPVTFVLSQALFLCRRLEYATLTEEELWDQRQTLKIIQIYDIRCFVPLLLPSS